MRKFVLGALAALPFLLASGQANALARTGKITSVFLSSPGNLPFRIALDNPPPECASGLLYVDMSNTNYQAYVSTLLVAYTLGKPIVVYYAQSQAVGQTLPACIIQEFGIL